MALFGEGGPAAGGGQFWLVTGVLVPATAALTWTAVKLWPLLIRSRRQRAAEAAARRAAEAREAAADRDADERKRRVEAKVRRDAHEQVRAEYSEFFERQRQEMEALRRDREWGNGQIRKLYDEMRNIDRAHADCLVKNERLAARLSLMEETVAALRVSSAGYGVPTRNEAVVVADEHGVIREWSPACTALFHWKSWEAVGREIDLIIPPAWRDRHWKGWKEVLQTGRDARPGPYLVEVVTRDGRTIPVELMLSSWSEGEGAARRRMFTASIRQRAVDYTGRTAEDDVDLGALTAAPLPEGSALSAVRKAEAEAAADQAAVRVAPAPAGGATVHVPPGGSVEVRKDDVTVEVQSQAGPADKGRGEGG